MTDIIIMGAGPAGLTAAVYAARAGLSTLVFSKGIIGGQVANTSEIENYPAFKKVTGADFCLSLYEQVENLGVQIKYEEIQEITISGDIKHVKTDSGEYETKALIIANGTERRKLGCEGEERLRGSGVSYCATCDGAFFRNKDVAVIGGGNTALEDVVYLSNICNKVYLVHRREEFRGEQHLVDKVMLLKNVEIIYNASVEEICGETNVEYIKIKKEGKIQELRVSGVFIAIGIIPQNSIFRDILELDKQGYIVSDESCRTDKKGIYAAGDTRTKTVRQIVTATADGAVAVHYANEYINSI